MVLKVCRYGQITPVCSSEGVLGRLILVSMLSTPATMSAMRMSDVLQDSYMEVQLECSVIGWWWRHLICVLPWGMWWCRVYSWKDWSSNRLCKRYKPGSQRRGRPARCWPMTGSLQHPTCELKFSFSIHLSLVSEVSYISSLQMTSQFHHRDIPICRGSWLWSWRSI